MPPSPDVDIDLLHALLTTREFRTLHGLSQLLHEDPVRLAARLDVFRQTGCLLESHPQQGVRLQASGLGCWADYIEQRHQSRIGQAVRIYRQTRSTQDQARRWVEAAGKRIDKLHGLVLIADEQTAGRGRLGRKWLAPPGSSLLLTCIVRGQSLSTERLMVATCCAVAEAIGRTTGIEVQIKWPNDVLIDGRKLAGILVEQMRGVSLIGIGLNVNTRLEQVPPELRPLVTSLTICDADVDRLRLLDVLLDELDRFLYHTPDRQWLRIWRNRSTLLQKRVTVEVDAQRLTGRVLDLDPRLGLLLEIEHGPVVHLPAATTTIVYAEP